MSEKTIIDFLNSQARAASDGKGHISFHMPGHKGRSELYEKTGFRDFARNMIACDITEIPGADALYHPETTLRTVMDNYAELYGAKHTELLVNGSSAGIIAAVLAAVQVGGKLILARNSHHAAFSALRLGGINPVYVRPKINPRSGLVGEIDPTELRATCEANPDAEAVLIASPNFYGMLSDIAALAAVAHEYNMVLIVDQAHGAHLRFFDYEAEALQREGMAIPFPRHSAEALGADIVVNSIHKTLLSFTGSSILNICSDAVDIAAVSDALRMLQTTSPSYLLMGSLDINEKIMRKAWRDIISTWRRDITDFYRSAARIPGLSLVGADDVLRLEESLPRGDGGTAGRPSAASNAQQPEARTEGLPADSREYRSAEGSAAGGREIRSADGSAESSREHRSMEGDAAAEAHLYSGRSDFLMYNTRAGLDLTKINISMAALGISGHQLERELRHRGIIAEMIHGDYVMLMTGAGNMRSDYGALIKALRELSNEGGLVRAPGERSAKSYGIGEEEPRRSAAQTRSGANSGFLDRRDRITGSGARGCASMGLEEYRGAGSGFGARGSASMGLSAPRSGVKPRSATDIVLEVAGVPYDSESVPIYRADGRVLCDPVIVYPPGTPIACPGEILTVEAISYISEAIGRGEKVTGVDEEGMVRVGRLSR